MDRTDATRAVESGRDRLAIVVTAALAAGLAASFTFMEPPPDRPALFPPPSPDKVQPPAPQAPAAPPPPRPPHRKPGHSCLAEIDSMLRDGYVLEHRDPKAAADRLAEVLACAPAGGEARGRAAAMLDRIKRRAAARP